MQVGISDSAQCCANAPPAHAEMKWPKAAEIRGVNTTLSFFYVVVNFRLRPEAGGLDVAVFSGSRRML